MATPNLTLILLTFSLLAISTAARPCKTLFFISSTTSYYHLPHNPNIPNNPNPNFFLLNNPSISPRIRTFLFTSTNFHNDVSNFRFYRPSIFLTRSDPLLLTRPDPIDVAAEQVEEERQESENQVLFGRPDPVQVEFYSSSIRDRTKDIMSVVGALLFGVGCGALTAATMYLIWSLFWPSNRFDFDEDEEEDDVSPKKMGYVAIPDDELKKPAAVQAKEVV